MRKLIWLLFLACSVACETQAGDTLQNRRPNIIKPDSNNAGLKLPSGFSALKVAENLGRARHIAVNQAGEIYVKLERKLNGNGIMYLRDLDKDGRAEEVSGFGNYIGTGIAIHKGYLYASSDEDVFRYKLNDKGQVENTDSPEKIITGLINRRQHASKSITLDNKGHIYVNIGAYSNACQEKDRQVGSMGMSPCPILDSAGGIWQFKADVLNQTYANGVRYATGLRNVVGLDWNHQTNKLFVTQHGRDQLKYLFPQYYNDTTSAEIPAETMYEINPGDNAGWPYVYFDNKRNKLILSPEYGGDGQKEPSVTYKQPTMAFPAHMAPNALLFYTGDMFPARYKNGAFLAFHGSWNRTPLPQEGFYVVFIPFENGKPTGKWEVFANGFAGVDVINSLRAVQHRPCGLAQGPDGSLYVSDDNKGTIFRIMFNGN
ncbi:MAG: PQQ-dependent sugar dehydrogenase [Bacteroidota bacterium]|jgi:glucose/arabinose dehydrogenase